MEELDFSGHARQMMVERSISEEWVRQTVGYPDVQGEGEDEYGRVLYYWKKIEGMTGSILKVTVNPNISPRRVVTLHPDRGKRRQWEKEGKL